MQQSQLKLSAGRPLPNCNRGLRTAGLVCLLVLSGRFLSALCAQTPSDDANYDAAWLRYARIEGKAARERYASLPATVVALGDSRCVQSAQNEVIRGVRGMLGRTLRGEATLPEEQAIVLGT